MSADNPQKMSQGEKLQNEIEESAPHQGALSGDLALAAPAALTTDLAAALAQCESLRAELGAARAQFQAVLDAVPGGVSWINSDLEYLGINARLASTFGLVPDNFVGKKIGFLQSSPEFSGFVTDFVGSLDQNGAREVDMTIDGQRRIYLLMGQKYGIGQSAVFVGIDITDRKEAEEKLFCDAFFDKLTGLPNRSLLLERLERALEYSKRREDYLFAVLFLDFDGFKHINDSLGHTVGDQLLFACARRLETIVRSADTVARLGGDEFVMLLDDIEDLSHATHIAERIGRAMTTPFHLNNQEIFISVSIGITLNNATYTQTEELLRDADTAMYRAKNAGRNRYEIFDRQMHSAAIERLELESDLHRALDAQDFVLHFQPIIDLNTHKLVSFEALVRWNRPHKGFTRPGEFIGLAEETGLIVRLDRWVLRTACEQMKSWIDEFGAGAPHLISVNLSSRQFAQSDLVACIAQILQETQLPASKLQLEITESAIMSNLDLVAIQLQGLCDLGIRLAIDDFGTGYSSLSYLHKLPLHTLKVDRSFAQEVSEGGQNLEIVRAIVMLAHALKMSVVAEGIETDEQRALFRDLGCEYAQGFYFARGLDVAAATALLENGVI
ncbi:diguanylate cyclase (GGDEF) domain-containing protein [Abditibacterium utsteinense]|uniref:Diguanylate cyclase (GGDEF) domain-containing protein n=1 Tax=Abditibacterium utsteinense TaxID=1960156 RepID=A0A2S8ST98_9BACT|nr:GGDEF and EAL domain-containing protein [Abditibacterium utsteinense]PQV64006.1 diguanylate cyclase (GGDEF) domain-containing protein [Abditibacterium utsteinense]